MSRLARAALVVVAAVVVLTVILWSLQRHLVYFPAGAPPPVEQALPGAEDATLTTADGLELGAWWLPGGPTAVIVLPGNAGNRAGRAALATALHDLGLSVLLVDYRGDGGNPGAPSEEGLLTDARAAHDWVTARPGIDEVVYFGESLGAAVAIGLAVERPPDALVLRSPFRSLVAMARAHYGPVPAWLLGDRYPSDERIGAVPAPVLILATPDDEVVPFAQSEALFAAANDPKAFVALTAVGHNDPALLDGAELIRAVADFLGVG